MRETRTYTIKNRALKERTVLLEHPIRGDWKLVDPKKPAETTRDLYRFQVKVPADTRPSPSTWSRIRTASISSSCNRASRNMSPAPASTSRR